MKNAVVATKRRNSRGKASDLRLLADICALAVILLLLSCNGRPQSADLRQTYEIAIMGTDSPKLVHRTAASGNKNVLQFLDGVAASPRASFANREAAISELAKIGSDEATVSIAHLLVPHNPVGLRQQAAQ